jgi:long-chain acyl-CoA synthetase
MMNGNSDMINRNNGYHHHNNGHANGTKGNHNSTSHGGDDVVGGYVCQPDDLSLIMYTSGTTGVPKGVMFSQKSLIEAFHVVDSLHNATTGARFRLTRDMSDLSTSCHFAYLPSAHIFEFCMEMFMLTLGARIGFGSPLTAFKTSPGVAAGSKGDAESLNPTFTIAVPLVCERIKSSICEEVSKKSPLVQQLFHFGIEYKNFWNSMGFSTPIIDKVLFSKTRLVFGNNLQVLVVGGAAIAEDTHHFLRAAIGTTMVQGYGTTETFALATVQSDLAYESDCGHLHSYVGMKLEDWNEGGYRVSDKPNPRGELVIGGRHISLGYYKRHSETLESFYADESKTSMRWFRTGDIVEIDRNLGTIKIIDRKKDLVKLMNGEFVALGQLESLFKNCQYVSNLMVCASSLHANIIVVAVPEEAAMGRLVDELGMDRTLLTDLPALCQDERVVSFITQNMQDIAVRSRLSKAEKPRKVILVPDQWTPDNGLTTASMKIRRKQLSDKYADVIQQAFNSLTAAQ